jgi:CRISPR-associated protein Cmr3
MKYGLRLDPLDTLFFRDGRPFDTATRATGGLPQPQTLAGAIRTALLAQSGFDLMALQAERQGKKSQENDRDLLQRLGAPRWILDLRFRGPWPALANRDTIEPLLPVPASLFHDLEKGIWHRAEPLKGKLPGWQEQDDLRPLWRRQGSDAKHPGGFLSGRGINAFLAGNMPSEEDWFGTEEVYRFDHRTGIEINPQSLTAAEGRIYGISLLSLCQEIERGGVYGGSRVCLYAEILNDERSDFNIPSPLPLGGEGRYVEVRKHPAWNWTPAQARERNAWLLATPAFLPGRRSLPDVSPAKLVAAASGSPVAFSGWDVARGGPKPTRFAVPAGSVYFVEGNFDPNQSSVCSDAEDVAQGWGFALRGVWNHG